MFKLFAEYLTRIVVQELDDPNLEPLQQQDLHRGLTTIRKEANVLPPMTNRKLPARRNYLNINDELFSERTDSEDQRASRSSGHVQRYLYWLAMRGFHL